MPATGGSVTSSPRSNILQFEDWADTSSEYELLDEVARDRESAAG